MVEWLTPENASLAEAAENAMRAFEGQQRKLTDLQQRMEEDSTSVRAKDRSLSLTFDGRGELTGMKFHGTKFRSMAPAELAHLIVETVRAGRTQYLEKMSENAGSSALLGVDFADLATGRADPGKIVETMLAPLAGQMGELWESAFGTRLTGSADEKDQGKSGGKSGEGKTKRDNGK